MRAFLLYHYLPFDKGPWGKARDPVHLLLTVLCLVPVYGVRMAFQALLLFLVSFGPLRPADSSASTEKQQRRKR